MVLVDRLKTLAPQEILHSVTANRDPMSGKLVGQPAAAAAGVLLLKNIDSDLDPQRRFQSQLGR